MTYDRTFIHYLSHILNYEGAQINLIKCLLKLYLSAVFRKHTIFRFVLIVKPVLMLW